MLFIMFISLFSTRILLKELGVEDYGIYNIVGGVVAIFGSLRTVFASATQRFINYEKGNSRYGGLGNIFNSSVTIHIAISIFFFIIVEIIGMYFINNRLNIDPIRLDAAKYVFHCSVLTAIFIIITVPYDAMIIANEDMNVFAYISIFDILLKLSAVCIITVIETDKLILYGTLIVLISLMTRVISIITCRKLYSHCKYKFHWDRDLIKEMGSFAGWNFLGNTSYAIANEGGNMLLNIFGGTTVNAARGISYQIRSAMNIFVANILLAVNPQLTSSYAKGDHKESFRLFYLSSKGSFFIALILMMPIVNCTESILNLWLTIIPDYTIGFVKLVMLFILLRSLHGPLDSIFKANGRIKEYQLIDGVILLLNLPLSYVALKIGYSYYAIFIIMIILEMVNQIAILLLSTKIIGLDLTKYWRNVINPCVKVLSCSLISYYICNNITKHSITIDLGIIISSITIVIISIFYIGFNRSDRIKIIDFIRNKYKLLSK